MDRFFGWNLEGGNFPNITVCVINLRPQYEKFYFTLTFEFSVQGVNNLKPVWSIIFLEYNKLSGICWLNIPYIK